jgi:DNA-binding beta-propeller fold protein YncE
MTKTIDAIRLSFRALAFTASVALVPTSADGAGTNAPLTLEQTIALDKVSGRIDHMAIDAAGMRLFVAELGNGAVDVVDLRTARVVGRIRNLREPQGVAYVPDQDLIAVTSGGDGSVRFYGAGDLHPVKTITLGEDADNIRIDLATGKVLVGYGNGALAIIDPKTLSTIGDVRLPGHPESFQVETRTNRAFVNIPDGKQVAVVDLKTGVQTAAWSTSWLWSNFPMALGEAGDPLAVVFRFPATLVVLDRATGAIAEKTPTCGDADDVFFDSKRSRFYVTCGEGAIDVLNYAPGRLDQIGRIATSGGARTGFYSTQLDRLYVAAPAGWLGSRAAILVFRPSP